MFAGCRLSGYDAEGESNNCADKTQPIGMQGITTAQMHGGVMQISHASVRNAVAENSLNIVCICIMWVMSNMR